MWGNEVPAPLWEVMAKTYEKGEKSQYTGTGILRLYDGLGYPLERWEIQGLSIESLTFDDLDFSGTDESRIIINWKYATATYASLVPPIESLPKSPIGQAANLFKTTDMGIGNIGDLYSQRPRTRTEPRLDVSQPGSPAPSSPKKCFIHTLLKLLWHG